MLGIGFHKILWRNYLLEAVEKIDLCAGMITLVVCTPTSIINKSSA